MKSLKFGNVVLCEHVVAGAGNKHTLVNVFGGNLVFQELPGGITLGVYVELLPQASLPDDLILELFLGKTLLAQVSVSIAGHDPTTPALIALPLIPVKVPEEATFKVRIKAEDYKSTYVLKRRFLRAPDPTA